MPRKAKGSVYESWGSLYLSVTLKKRMSFRLIACRTPEEAELRRSVIVDVVNRLKLAGRLDVAEQFCKNAAEADDANLGKLVTLMDGVLTGSERVAPPRVPETPGAEPPSSTIMFGEFSKLWTSNELSRRHRGRIKALDHAENVRKLRKHVLPIVFRGRTIAETPLREFSLDHADHVLSQPTLPEGSLRHVAQCMHRVLKVAVYPARLLERSPFPPGWLPSANRPKERNYLYPDEEAAVLCCIKVPLVWRFFFGFCAREGLRRENAVLIEWSNLTLDIGHVVLDETKNGRGGSWKLDDGTAEALRRWKRICPSERFVFPAEALLRHRTRRAGAPMYVSHAAAELRAALVEAGVKRPKLFQTGGNRLRIRAHDLRATFVTLALANGMTEDWVIRRTGHSSLAMVARYRREAKTAEELGLGWLKPMHEVIPELKALGSGGDEHVEPKLVVIEGGEQAPRGNGNPTSGNSKRPGATSGAAATRTGSRSRSPRPA